MARAAQQKHQKVNGARRTQQPNRMLPQQFQGREYAITSFAIQPEITIYDDEGKIETRFPAEINVAIFEKNFDKTLREIFTGAGFPMGERKP